MRLAGLLVPALVACGGVDGLEIAGDIALGVGTETITPTVGAAISDIDPAKLLIVIGTRDISCETNLESPLRKGTYVAMVIDPVVGVQPEATVTVIRVESSGTKFNGDSNEGTIDTVEGRITGSVSFVTQDETDEVVTELSAIGSFDVENCLQ